MSSQQASDVIYSLSRFRTFLVDPRTSTECFYVRINLISLFLFEFSLGKVSLCSVPICTLSVFVRKDFFFGMSS